MSDIFNLADTWNNGATTFTSLKMSVTNTASAAGSKLFDFLVDGTSRVYGSFIKSGDASGCGIVGVTGHDTLVAEFTQYLFGTTIRTTGGNNTNGNRFEFFLGDATLSQAPNLSVRHNGSNLGAIFEVRNAADTDGIKLEYTDASQTHPRLRFSDLGPYLVKEGTAITGLRNPTTPTESQRFWVANTYTEGGTREYLSIGVESANRFCVRAAGVGGGTQRPLDLDGSEIQLQAGGTMVCRVTTGLLQFAGTTSSFPAFKRSNTVLQARLADDSADAPISCSYAKTGSFTVATLPAAATAGAGARAFVSDANATTFLSTVAGGGANLVPVVSDGTNWKIG